MKFIWRGETFEMVEQSDLSWEDMELLEVTTGYTSTELGEPKAMGKARVIAALSWLSVRAQDESVTFADFFGSKISEWEPQDDGEEKQAPPPPALANDPLGGSPAGSS